MSEEWIERMRVALAEGGCKSQQEWVSAFPGKHCWFVFDLERSNYDSCACCGVVRRRDDANKPCKGTITIELR